jgi:prepilin-type N-terminal cleavage/methylation domain-containing protein
MCIKCRRGFSLTEVLVVVAIISIAAAIAVPNFINEMPRLRLAKAARHLLSDLQWTRQQAVVTNRPWRIIFDLNNNLYQILDSGADRAFGGADDRLVRIVALAEYGSGVQYGSGNAGLTWSADPASNAIDNRTTVTFSNRGMCDPGSTFLTNDINTLAYAVTTSIAGGIRIRMYNGMTPFHRNHWVEK